MNPVQHRPVFLVTGGSQGIGKAICQKIAQRGDVILLFTHKGAIEEAQDTLDALCAINPQTHAFSMSLEDRESIMSLVNEIHERFGRMDYLVNNAGILTIPGFLVALKSQELAEVVEVNLLGTMEMCRIVGKFMVKQRSGTILNISSTLAFRRTDSIYHAPYAASKAGVHGFTRSLAAEMARFGVKVMEIAPGWIDTDLIERLPKSLYKRLMETVPLQRFGKPEEIAEAVEFMLSGKCDYFIGQSMVIDGGISL